MLDFSDVRTYPLEERESLVSLSDLLRPEDSRVSWTHEDLDRLCAIISRAARDGSGVLWQMGAHVVKCGLSPLVIDLMERGFITHLAMNGATAIHDLELAMAGKTSESVADGIGDGTFGMVEETGRFINETINATSLGFGDALGRRALEEGLPHSDICLLAQAVELEVPVTVHVAIGTDIVHQHPTFDGAATGAAAHRDFRRYTETVAGLSGGVVLNFGSAVLLPEVFLKALSISRNLGRGVRPLYTASFDLRDDINDYFFRPRKNVVKRPTAAGGEGFNFSVRHEDSIPSIHRRLLQMSAEG